MGLFSKKDAPAMPGMMTEEEIAQAKAHANDWQTAMDEWGERMKRNPAVGQRFNALSTGRA